MRTNNRGYNELRSVEMTLGYSKHAEGSCLIKIGDTVVLCTASLEDRVPYFLKNTKQGWLTAEYGMLPRSTGTRGQRESTRGSQGGRTQEVQRLIGRSLRSVVDFAALGERQIILDCDVIQADGGTRTAAITGGYMALCSAIKKLLQSGIIKKSPIKFQIAAISCGLINGKCFLDLDYKEDSSAEVDANFVLNNTGKIIEIQSTAEKEAFSDTQLLELLAMAKAASEQLFAKQKEILDAANCNVLRQN